MTIKLANNVVSTTRDAISSTDTTLLVTLGTGSRFPALNPGDYFYATLSSPTGDFEIARVTARSGDLFTIVRAQESTTAFAFPANSRIEIRVTAQSVLDALSTATNYQGASSANPTTRLDGSPLVAGDFYFNTVENQVRFYTGAAWVPVASGSVRRDDFSGNGSTTAFTLSASPSSEDNTQVYINGVYQEKSSYSVSGTTLTFSIAPPNGSTIEVMVIENVGVVTADLVGYQPAGSGAVATNVQAKLRETVSVKDFGAVGDGVANDTAAIQAAINSLGAEGGEIIIPAGRYICTNNLTTKSNVSIVGTPSVSILDFSTKSSRANCLSATGTVSTPYPLLSDGVFESSTVTVSTANAANFAANDMVFVRSNFKLDPSVSNANGEINFVQSVNYSTGVVTLQTSLAHQFAVSDSAAIQKVTPVENINFEGLSFVGTGFNFPTGSGGSWANADGDHGITINKCKNVRISNCSFTNVVRMAVRIVDCFEWSVSGCNIQMPQEQTSNQIIYGICWLDYASNGIITNNQVYRGRHGIVNSDSAGFGYSKNIVVSSNTVTRTYVAALSTHTSGHNTVWANNTIEDCKIGIDLRTPNHVVTGNIFNNGFSTTNGECLILRQVASNIQFSNNIVKRWRFGARYGVLPDNYAWTNINIDNNMFIDCASGIDFRHLGNEKQSAPGTFNVTPHKDFSISDNTFKNTGTIAIQIYGYFENGEISNNKIDYSVDINNFSIRALGVRQFRFVDNTTTRSIGYQQGNTTTTGPTASVNASGVPTAIGSQNNLFSGNVMFDFNIGGSSTGLFISPMSFAGTARLLSGNYLAGGDVAEVASGVIAANNPVMRVDTEGGAASSNLTTINGIGPGQQLVLSNVNSARTVVVKNAVSGSDNLKLVSDFTLNDPSDTITLVYEGNTGFWREISRSNNG
jgi:hypothetical protein